MAAGRVPEFEPPWIYVLVLPIPGDPNQSWWVQPYPLVRDDGSWEAFIGVGAEDDQPGTPFDVCAIVSNEWLEPGRYGPEPPLPPSPPPEALSRYCISVTR